VRTEVCSSISVLLPVESEIPVSRLLYLPPAFTLACHLTFKGLHSYIRLHEKLCHTKLGHEHAHLHPFNLTVVNVMALLRLLSDGGI
jgi:hypothetical protein